MLTSLAMAMVLVSPPAYMGLARYPATSIKNDETAPGGFGTTDYPPTKITNPASKKMLNVVAKQNAVSVTLANHNNPDLWLQATDSNLRGWLEVQDGETWKPAQYQYWASCGNSYHKVFLAQGSQFQYNVELPKGSWKTKVRFVLLLDGKVEYSAPTSLTTSKLVMQLDPAQAKENKVDTRWFVPTLLPKDM